MTLDMRDGAPPQSAVSELSDLPRPHEPRSDDSAAAAVIVPEQRSTTDLHHWASCGDDRELCERLRSDPLREDSGCLFDFDEDGEPASRPDASAQMPGEIALLFDVTAALVQAERAATRVLVADLRPPTGPALVGMVRRVVEAGSDRWTAVQWLEERIAVHVLTGGLTEQQAAATLDRTLAHLGAPPPGDHRDGTARLQAAAARAYHRVFGDAAARVREHLTREWAEAVDELARAGVPLGLVDWLVVARQWLSDVETAEANG